MRTSRSTEHSGIKKEGLLKRSRSQVDRLAHITESELRHAGGAHDERQRRRSREWKRGKENKWEWVHIGEENSITVLWHFPPAPEFLCSLSVSVSLSLSLSQVTVMSQIVAQVSNVAGRRGMWKLGVAGQWQIRMSEMMNRTNPS